VNRAAAVVAILVIGTACGGNFSQADARDRATKASCDWYEQCGEIGANGQFQTWDQCEVDARAFWNNAWSYEVCNDRILPEDLDSCLNAIDGTLCGNGLDWLNTIANKCNRETVCSG
jgi:hypothetical protein